MKFVVDRMLGTLARRLRLLGYDAAYGITDDDELLRTAQREGRLLLTRDRALARRAGDRAMLVTARGLLEQTVTVAALAPDAARPFSRCGECNTPLAAVTAAAVRDRVSEYVARTHAEFRECPGCGRVYWPGSHLTRGLNPFVSTVLARVGRGIDGGRDGVG